VPVLAACVAVGVGGLAAVAADADALWFWLGVATLSASTVAVLGVLARRSRDALSPLGLTAIFYLLGYAAGAVYFWFDPLPSSPVIDRLPLRPAHEDLTVAVWVATLAWAAFVIGYAINPLRAFARAIPRPRGSRAVTSPLLLMMPFFVAGWAARTALVASGRYFHAALDEQVAGASSYVIFVLSNAPLVATAYVGAYAYLNRDERRRDRYRKAFWALAAVELLWTIPTGSRGQIIAVVTVVLVVGYYGNSAVARLRAIAAVGLLVVFFVFPFTLYYRNNSRADYRLAPHTALADAVTLAAARPPGDAAADGVVAAFSRFSDVASLAEIVRRPPSYSGRAPGETLTWTAESLVPRAILPQKGDPGIFGNEFGQRYGLLSTQNHQTSVAISQPGELYINFGVAGTLLMALVGAVYRGVGDYLAARCDDAVALAIYAGIAWPIVSSQETILASGMTGMLKTLVVFSVGFAFALGVRGRRVRHSGRPDLS
jgi:hypothetical protein